MVWTGVSNQKESNNLKIFPNPAKEIINFQIDHYGGNIILQLFDSKGSLIKQVNKSTNHLILNLTEFQTGLYFYSLQLDNKIIKDKFIIIK